MQNLNLASSTDVTQRPAYGTQGRPITLWANYFELLPNPNQPFNRYAISVLPVGSGEVPTGKKLARIVQLVLQQLPPTIPIATDTKSTLITPKTLGFTNKEFQITYYPETEKSPNDKSPKFRAKLEHTGTLTFETLLNYLSSSELTVEKPAVKDEIIQAMNIVLGHGMRQNSDIITRSSRSGRNKYFPNGGNLMDHWLLSSGLQAFRGFFMSVRAATGRILLNVQVQHLAAYEVIRLDTFIDKLQGGKMSPDKAERMIVGLWVHVAHLNNRLKRIAGFASPRDGRGKPHPPVVPRLASNATDTKFYKDSVKPPRNVSVAEHFKQTWKPLQRPQMPVINVGTKVDPVYLPAEVCMIKKGQSYDSKLSPEATTQMIKNAVRPAPENARTIAGNGIHIIEQNSEQMLNSFGVQFNKSLVTVPARMLDGFNLEYSGKIERPRDASWNMRDVKFSKGATLPSWSVLWIALQNSSSPFSSLQDVDVCVDKFHKMLLKCGIRAPAPQAGRTLQIRNADDPGPEVDTAFRAVKVPLLLVILPNNKAPIYNAVKQAGDIKYGIHTINVVGEGRKFAKGLQDENAQYFANVALKLNLKFGGQNQLLRNADLGFVSEGKTMLVGMDVTHPSPGSSKQAPSVSSITASVDAKLGQWPADVRIQTKRQEMIEFLKEMFKSRLLLWQKHNKQQLPEEILVYRDGVGETMYDLVRNIELPQIREACKEIYPATATKANKPYVTIIICGKRHHTRFYPTSEQDADPRTGGTKNGTVVDRGVTESRIWDFYMQAHTALQGTPKSAHYVVVHDEIFRRRAAAKKTKGEKRSASQRAADDLESLTHALCYMFGRATKAVSLVPPAYYADLVCNRARLWLSKVFDERTVTSSDGGSGVRDEDVQVHANLKDSMFYI